MKKKIAIYGSRSQDAYLNGLRQMFMSLWGRKDIEVVVHPKLADYLVAHGVDLDGMKVSSNLSPDTSLLLSIGGDGTFMRASRWVGRDEIPILGVNTGHLGFLSGCSLPEVTCMTDAFLRGDLIVERRMMLHVICDALPLSEWPYALNDVALIKEETASMINIATRVNGNFLADYRADGLIVATPTGSTAYNLSAGGPIMEPTLSCMVLSPVAPHTLTVRPLVVDGDSEIELVVDGRTREFRISLDGRSFTLPCGSRIRIRRADFCTMMVRGRDSNFATILREKLLWATSTVNG